MSRSVYINLAAKDLAAARAFYTKIGFSINEDYTSDQSVAVVVDERIMLLLASEDFFKQIIKRDIADADTVREVSVAIQVADRAEVDKMIEAGLSAGGKEEGEATEDKDIGMYSRSLCDLDGHLLGFLCMGV